MSIKYKFLHPEKKINKDNGLNHGGKLAKKTFLTIIMLIVLYLLRTVYDSDEH